MDLSKYIKIPVSELVKPKAGYICYSKSWWAVTDDNCVLFYKDYNSPQCNNNLAVIKLIIPSMKYLEIEMAFIPHKCSDYC